MGTMIKQMTKMANSIVVYVALLQLFFANVGSAIARSYLYMLLVSFKVFYFVFRGFIYFFHVFSYSFQNFFLFLFNFKKFYVILNYCIFYLDIVHVLRVFVEFHIYLSIFSVLFSQNLIIDSNLLCVYIYMYFHVHVCGF